MGNLNEYIKEYKELLKEETSILKSIRDKKIAYEKEVKKNKQKLGKLRLTKSKLSNKSIKKKVFSVSLSDLIKELAKLTNSNVKNIDLNVRTDAVLTGPKKKTMKQMLNYLNEDKNTSLGINIDDNSCENPYRFYFSCKLDIFAKLSNKESLANYFYLKGEKRVDVEGGFDVYTALCIKEEAWDKIVYNFSLEDLLQYEINKDYSGLLLQKAVLNCANKKVEEKIK